MQCILTHTHTRSKKFHLSKQNAQFQWAKKGEDENFTYRNDDDDDEIKISKSIAIGLQSCANFYVSEINSLWGKIVCFFNAELVLSKAKYWKS